VVRLRGVSKHYGATTAVSDLDLEVHAAEVLALLGPNGAGKTTTVEMCEGFVRPDAGTIEVLGLDPIADNARLRARIGVMLQGGGGYPAARAGEMLTLVASYAADPLDPQWLLTTLGLTDAARTTYRRLSGGQQQRLCIARALAAEPEVLLLDEPLSNLDAKLRDRMRSELKRLQRDLNLTTVYVTHDQNEALALSHEIAVMNEGRIVQIGTPRQIYEQPADRFVADFVGTTNFIGGTVTALAGGRCVVSSAMGEIKAHASEGVRKDAAVIVSVRPEDVELSEAPPAADDGDNVCKGTIDAKDFLGDYLDFRVKVGDVVLSAKAHPSLRTPTGDSIYLRMKADKCVVISHR